VFVLVDALRLGVDAVAYSTRMAADLSNEIGGPDVGAELCPKSCGVIRGPKHLGGMEPRLKDAPVTQVDLLTVGPNNVRDQSARVGQRDVFTVDLEGQVDLGARRGNLGALEPNDVRRRVIDVCVVDST